MYEFQWAIRWIVGSNLPVSVYSVPEKDPEPYDTEMDFPVEVPPLSLVLAPTQVLEEPVSTIKENWKWTNISHRSPEQGSGTHGLRANLDSSDVAVELVGDGGRAGGFRVEFSEARLVLGDGSRDVLRGGLRHWVSEEALAGNRRRERGDGEGKDDGSSESFEVGHCG